MSIFDKTNDVQTNIKLQNPGLVAFCDIWPADRKQTRAINRTL